MIVSFFGFQLMYWTTDSLNEMIFPVYRKMKRAQKNYWRASIVSTVHAIVVTYLAIQAALPHLDQLFEDPYIASEDMIMCSQILAGYLLSDLILVLMHGSQWGAFVPNLFHHGFGVYCFALLCYQRSYMGYLVVGCILEITTPFVNLRYFLSETGMKSHWLYAVNGLIICLSWLTFRIIMYGYAVFIQVTNFRKILGSVSPEASFALFVSTGIGYVLQLFWGYKIFNGAYKLLTQAPVSKKEK